MDYGGHDSAFHSNVVIALHGQNCIGTASFVFGHEDLYFDNDCVVYGKERVDDLFEVRCDPAGEPFMSMPPLNFTRPPTQNCNKDLAPNAALHGFNNRYYTPLANATATCDCCGERPLAQLPPGLADNYTSSGLPTAETIISWGRAKLLIPQ